MTATLPPWANDDMAITEPATPGPYATAPAGDLPGTGATTVASGAGPALGIKNTEEITGAQVQDSPAFEAVDSALPASCTGPVEKLDVAISNGTAAPVARPADTY